jgi:hypothetical protein
MEPKKMTKYTPGPWLNRRGLILADRGNYCDRIADMDKDNKNIEADAAIIAAAPELLEALILAEDLLDGSTLPEERKQIRKAIAKAGGR